MPPALALALHQVQRLGDRPEARVDLVCTTDTPRPTTRGSSGAPDISPHSTQRSRAFPHQRRYFPRFGPRRRAPNPERSGRSGARAQAMLREMREASARPSSRTRAGRAATGERGTGNSRHARSRGRLVISARSGTHLRRLSARPIREAEQPERAAEDRRRQDFGSCT